MQVTKLCCPAIDARSDHGERGHKFGVPVALHDLGRQICWLQSQFLAHRAFNSWIDVCMRADCAADFANPNAFECLCQPLLRSAEFIEHEREL